MANVFLTDMQMLNQGNNESVDTALSAFEKDMFGGSSQMRRVTQVTDDVRRRTRSAISSAHFPLISPAFSQPQLRV